MSPLLSLAGGDNFYDGIEDMIGYRPGPWMKYSWAVITPVLCVVSSLLLWLRRGTFAPWVVTYSPAWCGPVVNLASVLPGRLRKAALGFLELSFRGRVGVCQEEEVEGHSWQGSQPLKGYERRCERRMPECAEKSRGPMADSLSTIAATAQFGHWDVEESSHRHCCFRGGRGIRAYRGDILTEDKSVTLPRHHLGLDCSVYPLSLRRGSSLILRI
jgi:hypothetical protein